MNATFSALPRVLSCVASEALSHTDEPETIDATRGHGVHDFLVEAREHGRDAALALVPEDAPHRQLCEQLPLDELPTGGFLEVAIALNVRTGKAVILGFNIGRAYRRNAAAHHIDLDSHDWYVGSLDMLGTASGVVVVVDYKSGFYSVGSPKTSAQLLAGALAGARLTGADRAHVSFIYLREDGTYHRVSAELDDLDLAAFEEQLQELPARIEAARSEVRRGLVPEVHAGDWCRFCPAKRGCPLKVAAAAAMGADLVQMRKTIDHARGTDKRIVLSPEEAGAIYARAKEFIEAAEAVAEDMKDLARSVPLPLPNGKVLKECTDSLPTKVSPEVAEQVLLELHGPEIANAAVKSEKRTSLKAITDALRPIAPPKKLASMERQAFNEIRRAGGLVEGSYQRVREVKAGS